KVHGTGGGSDEAERLRVQHLRARALHARLDGGRVDAVPLADHQHTLSVEIHRLSPFKTLGVDHLRTRVPRPGLPLTLSLSLSEGEGRGEGGALFAHSPG